MSPESAKQKMLIIGWDAADWKVITPLMDAGLMPNLERLVEAGVMGNIATLQPCLSPILWTSIATGKLADKHGILGFIEPDPSGSGVRLSSSTSRKTKAFWNIFSQQKLRTHVVGWYASHPAEPINGVCVTDQFMGVPPSPGTAWSAVPGAVHPSELAEEIARLRVHPLELSAGDLAPFVPRLSETTADDPRPAKIAAALAKCASVHAAATAILDAEPWDVLAVYYDALDVLGHDFMAYQPPRLPHVSERDFTLYAGVISGLYQFHDMMLGRLMQLAGDDAAILLVSDHGFHSDHLRPSLPTDSGDTEETAALWHRQFGVLVLRGKNIKRDERVYGATLLDVAPTLLHLQDMPVGNDMDGRVLTEIFETPREVRRIGSWDDETTGGDAGMHEAATRQDPFASGKAIEHLIALGYLAAATRDEERAVDVARAEAQFNLASTHIYAGRYETARGILESLCESHPERPRYQVSLARTLSLLGKHDPCRSVIERLHERFDRTIETELLLAAAKYDSGDGESARAELADLERRFPNVASLHQVAGGVHAAQRQWADAESSFRRAVEIDAENEQAQFGLACALAEQSQFEPAAEHALQALALRHFFPAAHRLLGILMEAMGERDRAVAAYQMAISLQPGFTDVHARLAKIYHTGGDVQSAMKHERASQGYGLSR